MTDTDDKTIQLRATIYFKKNIPVHITKYDGEWLNGFITEANSDFLMIDEFKNNLMPVFFSEIKNIQTYTKEIKE